MASQVSQTLEMKNKRDVLKIRIIEQKEK